MFKSLTLWWLLLSTVIVIMLTVTLAKLGLLHDTPSAYALAFVIATAGAALWLYLVYGRGQRNSFLLAFLPLVLGANIVFFLPPKVESHYVSLLIPLGIGFVASCLAIWTLPRLPWNRRV